MATKKNDRGMPIIKRHKPVESVSNQRTGSEAEMDEVIVVPITFPPQQATFQELSRNTTKMPHTFF